jgi:hypothetical protein
LIANGRLGLALQSTFHFDKKSHIWQAHHWYSQSVKKIVAHIQRTVTIATIQTTLDVSVSEDMPHAPAIPSGDPEFVNLNPGGEKDEKVNDVLVRSRPARLKPAGRVRPGSKSKRAGGRAARNR